MSVRKKTVVGIVTTLIVFAVVYLSILWSFDPTTCGGRFMTVECLVKHPENVLDSDPAQQLEKINYLMASLRAASCNPSSTASLLELRKYVSRCSHCVEMFRETQLQLATQSPDCYLAALGTVSVAKSEIRSDMADWSSLEGASICGALADFHTSKKFGPILEDFCN